MKVGDLVKLRSMHRRQEERAGLVVELLDKKVWRTDAMGKNVNWDKAKTEPHAKVLVGEKYLTIPVSELKVVGE